MDETNKPGDDRKENGPAPAGGEAAASLPQVPETPAPGATTAPSTSSAKAPTPPVKLPPKAVIPKFFKPGMPGAGLPHVQPRPHVPAAAAAKTSAAPQQTLAAPAKPASAPAAAQAVKAAAQPAAASKEAKPAAAPAKDPHARKSVPSGGFKTARKPGTMSSVLRGLAAPSSFAIWLLCVAAAVYLHYRGLEFEMLTGRLETLQEQVSPLETARLVSIFVAPGQPVTNGQPLAIMDTSVMDAEIQQQEASLTREMADNEARFQGGLLQMYERFKTAVSDAEAALSMEKRTQAEDTAELKSLDDELARYMERVKAGLSAISEVNMAKARQAALKERLNQYPKTIAELEKKLEEAKEDADLMKQWLESGANDQAVDVLKRKLLQRQGNMEQEIKMLKARRNQYMLHASRNGTVSRLLMEPGFVVPAGTPVVSIVETNSQRIISYLSESSRGISTNMPATVIRRSDSSARYPAFVESMSPEIEVLPTWNNQVANQVVRGRRITLIITTPHQMLPGEVVSVSVATHGGNAGAQFRRMKEVVRSWFTRNPPSAAPDAVHARPAATQPETGNERTDGEAEPASIQDMAGQQQ